MLLGLFLLGLLIALNAFFVAAEFAIVKVRYSAVEMDATSGKRIAKLSQSMLDHMDAYLSAAQIGITLASLALGWVGEPVVAKGITDLMSFFAMPVSEELAHQIAIPVGFIIITLLHLIFGEAVPKYAAIFYPQRFTYACAVPLRLFAMATAPLVWAINRSTWIILAPTGIKVASEHGTHTEEELRLLMAESAASGEQGAIQKTEHELIERVFTFDERLVRHIMVPRPQMVAIHVDASSEQIFEMLELEGYSRIPVYSDSRDTIIGVVHSKDLLRRIRDGKPFSVKEIARRPYFVPETKRIGPLLRELQSKRTHMAIVVDEFGVTSGLVTLEDIVEELVGEIQDEHDDERPIVETRRDGSFLINAHASINDVNAHLPKPLPESSDYSTVAGFVNIVFGGIPEVGDLGRSGDYEIKILKRSGGSVDSVLMSPLEEPEKEEDSGV